MAAASSQQVSRIPTTVRHHIWPVDQRANLVKKVLPIVTRSPKVNSLVCRLTALPWERQR